jgi:phospholipid/cholesterol/gamma-HCH transport system ATP-binding protein
MTKDTNENEQDRKDEGPIVSVKKLELSFDDNHVLQGFDVDLQEGENLVVIGKSGSGKSVLIKCIVGLVAPDAGEIRVFNEDVLKLQHDELDKLRLKIGFLFQSDALYDSMTVRENLEFPLRHRQKEMKEKEREELVKETLDSVGLAKTIDQMPGELSGGMKKRIALARTLILKPKIILYDEPTSGLDSVTGREIAELIVEIREKYKTSSIIISHDLRCAQITANRLAVLIDGKCHTTGTYEEMESSDDPAVKQFFT